MALFSFRKKAGIPHRRGGAPRPGRADRGARPALRDAPLDQAAVPRGPRAGGLRPGLLLGRGAEVLADRRASIRRRSATRAASRRTRPTRRCARGLTGHAEVVLVVFDPEGGVLRLLAPRLLGGPRSHAGHAAGERRGTQYRSAIYTYGDAQRRGRGRVARRLPVRARARGLRPDHDRDPARAALLLRRGLPPAVPRQESGRLLRNRRHRRGVPAGVAAAH